MENKNIQAGLESSILLLSQQTFNNYKIFSAQQGHGFAAERLGDIYDKITLKDATIIGGDNAKNGADRLVNGEYIQTKFYNNASGTVNSAFGEDGMYKYLNPDGNPMQLEVPKDQYDKALEGMQRKIAEGKVSGYTDPNEAAELIRKSPVDYQTAVDVAKAGTVKGLAYDISTGVISSTFIAGVSGAVIFTINYWKTGNLKESFKVSLIPMRDVFCISLTSHVITAQLARTALGRSLADTFGQNVVGSAIGAFTIITFKTIIDLNKVSNGDLHPNTLLRNLGKNTVAVSGGAIGAGIGYEYGGVLGAIAGGVLGGMAGSMLGSKIFDYNKKDVKNNLMYLNSKLEEYLAQKNLFEFEVNSLDFKKIKAAISSERGISFLMEDFEKIETEVYLLLEKEITIVKERRKPIDLEAVNTDCFGYIKESFEEVKNKMKNVVSQEIEIIEKNKELAKELTLKLDF